MKSRNNEIDFIKGVAIFLVVYGHAIQFLNNGEFDFFKHPLFIFIYSFHMPLFMIVSGYLLSYSRGKYSPKETIINKFKRLIVPVISWVMLFFLFKTVIKVILGAEDNFILSLLKSIKSMPYTLWFLWGVFYCTIIVSIVNKYLNDSKLAYILIFILMMITPDYLNSHLYKFVYPYFIIGYFIKDYKSVLNNKVRIISFILFPIMLLLWNKEYYIYISKFSLLNQPILIQLESILFRGMIGFVGIVVVISAIRYYLQYGEKIHINNFICTMGMNSLGIYIISDYMYIILDKINIPFYNIYLYTFIFTPIATFIIVKICINICNYINSKYILRKYLLGGK